MTDLTPAITAAFDSGNIRLVAIEGDRIDLEIVHDHQSDFFQWFHFRLANAAGRALTFRILNAGKSAYPFGWPGYSSMGASSGGYSSSAGASSSAGSYSAPAASASSGSSAASSAGASSVGHGGGAAGGHGK